MATCRKLFAASSRRKSHVLLCRYFAQGQTRFTASISAPQRLQMLANEAEKVVGYPTFLIRYLLNDEISGALIQSKKLVGSRHPLVRTARRLVYDEIEGFETVGLVVLLMARTGEPLAVGSPPLGQEVVSGVQKNQRKLAEVAEAINAGYMVHLGVMNEENFQPSDDAKIMNFGNKISVLSGDFLLAKASVGLSELENTQVVEVMAEVIGDIVEGEMLKHCNELGNMKWTNWENIVFKARGSLFANSCLTVLKLASLSQKHQDAAFSFGRHLSFLQQLHKDYRELSSDLQSIPVINSGIILAKDSVEPDQINDSYVLNNDRTKTMLKDNNVRDKMQEFCTTYSGIALENLSCFPSSEAKDCLENLVKYLRILTVV